MPTELIQTSLDQTKQAVKILTPLADFVAYVENQNREPSLPLGFVHGDACMHITGWVGETARERESARA